VEGIVTETSRQIVETGQGFGMKAIPAITGAATSR
jgi:hypothetical protein